jgi:hypothetical protein
METLTPFGGRLARTTARAVAWNSLSWFLSKVLVLAKPASGTSRWLSCRLEVGEGSHNQGERS